MQNKTKRNNVKFTKSGRGNVINYNNLGRICKDNFTENNNLILYLQFMTLPTTFKKLLEII
jgi:hypothetical protein